jgi:thiamine transport system ATP-binding protein
MLRFDRVQLRADEFRLAADLTMPAGARVAVLGPSGAGKSTLLAAVAGFIRPEQGRILWQGADLGPLGPGVRPVTILFQDQNLFPHLTVGQNVGLGLSPALLLSQADLRRVDAALERVGLSGFATRRPGTLSGGEQGRVALARAVLRARPLMLLDEPFAALGPALKAEMLDLVAEIAGETGATVLMVSHDPSDALRLCPTTVLVADGWAHDPLPTTELLSDPPPALRAYLGKAHGTV